MTSHASGERMIVPCQGGPNWMGWLRVDEPLPLEVPYGTGTYVLECGTAGTAAGAAPAGDRHAGCIEHRYVFVDDT